MKFGVIAVICALVASILNFILGRILLGFIFMLLAVFNFIIVTSINEHGDKEEGK